MSCAAATGTPREAVRTRKDSDAPPLPDRSARTAVRTANRPERRDSPAEPWPGTRRNSRIALRPTTSCSQYSGKRRCPEARAAARGAYNPFWGNWEEVALVGQLGKLRGGCQPPQMGRLAIGRRFTTCPTNALFAAPPKTVKHLAVSRGLRQPM